MEQLERMTASKMSALMAAEAMTILPNLMALGDEYDPLRPNEYEEFSKRRKKQMREEERKSELEEREKYGSICHYTLITCCYPRLEKQHCRSDLANQFCTPPHINVFVILYKYVHNGNTPAFS